jgi:DNA helicase-2/ATP-dependent DNA helicase PcrA
MALLEERARKEGGSLWEATGRLLQEDFLSGRARQGLTSFQNQVETLSRRTSERPSAVIRALLVETGLLTAIDAEGESAARDRRENLEQLVASAAEYEATSGLDGEAALAGFVDSITLLSDADSLGAGAPCLLLTIHAAKGLEFDVVFLAGLEEGLFPHVRAAGDARAIEEERRLFYVGVTRARRRLLVSYARSRYLGYGSSSRSPSRFLAEIPPDAFESPPVLGESKKSEAAPRNAVRPGALVSHATFGEGRVVEASGSGRDRKVTVLFRKAGRKRLLLEYAGLRVVG